MTEPTEPVEPVKRKVKVLKAEWVKDAESILILGECQEGRFRQQIHKDCFTFGDKDVATEMKKLADLMVGKSIYMVFDPNLDSKIEKDLPLNY
jgi:hypothetical protein